MAKIWVSEWLSAHTSNHPDYADFQKTLVDLSFGTFQYDENLIGDFTYASEILALADVQEAR